MPKREKRSFLSYITKDINSEILDMLDSEIINNRLKEPLKNYEEYAEKRIRAAI